VTVRGRGPGKRGVRGGLPLRLTRTFVAEPQAVPATRREMEALAGTLGPEARRLLTAVACELVGNSVRHGSRHPTDSIALEVFSSPERARLQVTDGGTGFEPPAPPRPGELRIGGWGLLLVRRLTDRWGTVRGELGGLVWCELRLPAS
jgi:anti-sigma regulatory factor (Ser/Thr protein kinase)